ncbi:hypothetical protein E2C01_027074 [Portunus trituberculatus]|uniref:Uncharacterized protein n=1 Tax=Portunus trituberculatus TaxID=210409 RepID=A0A5B7EKK3_PORTR|nr:hypothetical protein [Portunus trituberculatus]
MAIVVVEAVGDVEVSGGVRSGYSCGDGGGNGSGEVSCSVNQSVSFSPTHTLALPLKKGVGGEWAVGAREGSVGVGEDINALCTWMTRLIR